MRIVFQKIGITPVLFIEHGSLRHAINLAEKGVDLKTTNMLARAFRFVNEEIWANLPNDRASALYHSLLATINRCEQGGEVTDLIGDLMQLVAAMMEVVDIEWVRILVGSSHKVYVPRSVHEIYTRGGENPGSEAQTYIRREYLDLVALSVMLKVMLPVWVVFYNRTGASISKSNREKFALRLLWCSQVMAMPAMAKLNTFIQHYIRASNSVEIRLKVAVMGAGSADFTEVMMAGLITTLNRMLLVMTKYLRQRAVNAPLSPDCFTELSKAWATGQGAEPIQFMKSSVLNTADSTVKIIHHSLKNSVELEWMKEQNDC
jgi:hypothetical protein